MQSGGGRELREEVVYRILYSPLPYHSDYYNFSGCSLSRISDQLTDTGEIVEASNAGPVNHPTVQSGITDDERQIPEFEKPATTDVLDLTKVQTQYRKPCDLKPYLNKV